MRPLRTISLLSALLAAGVATALRLAANDRQQSRAEGRGRRGDLNAELLIADPRRLARR
jgi:hypothetical protein